MKNINNSEKYSSSLKDKSSINENSSNEYSNSYVSKNYSTTVSPKESFKTIPNISNDFNTSLLILLLNVRIYIYF
jgi:hypothetical protein